MAAHKAIKSIAGIIRMQLNDAVEMAGAKFVLKNFNFWFDGSAPEFTVEVTTPPGAARVIFEAGRVANGIDLKEEIFRKFGCLNQVTEKPGSSESARGLVAVDCREDANANRVAAVRSAELEAGKRVFFAADFERAKLVGLNVMGAA